MGPTTAKKFEDATGEPLPGYAAKIPPLVLDALANYLYYGYKPGHFLTCVLVNDLFGAIARADNNSLAAMRELTQLVYNRTPSACWGSHEKIEEWGKRRKAALAEAAALEAAVGHD